jgi:integrase
MVSRVGWPLPRRDAPSTTLHFKATGYRALQEVETQSGDNEFALQRPGTQWSPRQNTALYHPEQRHPLSSFYKYLAGAAAELRLPVNVPNSAHARFIARESSDPLEGTRALTATRARQLMGLPAGDGVLDFRDRAILKTYLYTGIRLATACRLRVRDFHQDGDEATLIINEKGNRHRTIGIHFAAAEALAEYLGKAGLAAGPIFRARRAPHSDELGDKPMSEASMYRVIADYVAKLPGAVKEGARLYSTHSLRATTATLLRDAGVDIRKVQELLGHRHITTTQIYDNRRRTTKESASHDVPIWSSSFDFAQAAASITIDQTTIGTACGSRTDVLRFILRKHELATAKLMIPAAHVQWPAPWTSRSMA